MTTEMNRSRIVVILLFAMVFTMVGYLAPVLYATYVPADQVIETHEFTAQGTTPDADEHYICFDRTVHHPSSGNTYTELYLVMNDGQRVEVDSSTMQRYYQGGRSQVVTPVTLPDNLEEGTYRYVLVIDLNMADGRVTKTMSFTSEPFEIDDDIEPVTGHEEAIDRCG